MDSAPSAGAFGLVKPFAYGPAFEQEFRLENFAGNLTGTRNVIGNYAERLASLSLTLTCVGGAGVRFGLVSLLDQDGIAVGAVSSPFSVAAGFASRLSFTLGGDSGGAANAAAITTGLPNIFLPPAYSIVVSVTGGLAADTVSNLRGIVDRFSTAPPDYPPGSGDDPGRMMGEPMNGDGMMGGFRPGY